MVAVAVELWWSSCKIIKKTAFQTFVGEKGMSWVVFVQATKPFVGIKIKMFDETYNFALPTRMPETHQKK